MCLSSVMVMMPSWRSLCWEFNFYFQLWINNQYIFLKIILPNDVLYKGHPSDIWIFLVHWGMAQIFQDFPTDWGPLPHVMQEICKYLLVIPDNAGQIHTSLRCPSYNISLCTVLFLDKWIGYLFMIENRISHYSKCMSELSDLEEKSEFTEFPAGCCTYLWLLLVKFTFYLSLLHYWLELVSKQNKYFYELVRDANSFHTSLKWQYFNCFICN